MARRLLMPESQKTDSQLQTISTGPIHQNRRDPLQLKRLLGKKRSTGYVYAMSRLDIGDPSQRLENAEDFIRMIREELPEVSLEEQPIGIVSKCYLGEPYEVHTLDAELAIIEHYKRYEALPAQLEHARTLANNRNYDFVEVYPTFLRAVKSDGTVATIEV